MSLGAARAANTRQYQLLNTGTITSTGSQSYTIPAGTLYLEIEMWGGGGGGGLGKQSSGRGGSTYQAGEGGGGAAYVKHKYYGAQDMLEDDTLNFTIGSGGAGADLVGPDENTGADGGDTSINTHKRNSTTITTFSSVQAGAGYGGQSGSGLCVTGRCGDGGEAINGNVTNTDGSDGEAQPSSSGTCMAGVAGGDAGNGGSGGAGGNMSTGNASDGTAPGGGGGSGAGCCTTCGSIQVGGDGGDGGDGKVIVKAYG